MWGILAFFVSMAWIFSEASFARRDRLLTLSQMKKKYPSYRTDLPFIWHFGMWSDLFLISPLIGFLIAYFSVQWSSSGIITLSFIALLLSGLFHFIFAFSPFPDSLVWRQRISRAGWLHIIYTTAILTIIGLLFFSTEEVSFEVVAATAAIVALHTTLASKVFLGIINKYFLKYRWLPTLLKKPDQWLSLIAVYTFLICIVFLTT